MALTLSGTDGVVGAGFTLDASGASVTAGVGTFGNSLIGGHAKGNNDSSKLSVFDSSSNIGILQVHCGTETLGTLAGITFGQGGTNATARAKTAIAAEGSGGYGRSDLCFYVDSVADNNPVSASDEKIRIMHNGNIGIGTTIPDNDIDIMKSGEMLSTQYKTTSNNGIYLYYDANRSGTGTILAQHSYRRNGTPVAAQEFRTTSSDNSAFIAFKTHDGTSLGERLRIDKGGQLMIATTSTSGISVDGDDIIIGSIDDSTNRGITLATTGQAAIRWADAGDNAMGRIQYNNGTDIMNFYTSNVERLRIDADGDVTIIDANLSIDKTGTTSAADLTLIGGEGTQAQIQLRADEGDDSGDNWRIMAASGFSNRLIFYNGAIGSQTDTISFTTAGSIRAANGTASAPTFSFTNNTDAGLYSDVDNTVYMAIDGTVRQRFNISHFSPGVDNAYDLGNASYRWDDVRATNGTIATSDRNEKNTITATDLGLDFVNKLTPVSYKFNSGTRTHYGLIAQDIETVLTGIGKSTTNFAGFIKDTGDDDGNSFDPARYGLRYQEFISPMIKAIQELSVENTALKARLDAGGL